MTTTNFPQGITSYGIPVIGSGANIPITNTGGTTWFVSSTLGNAGNTGTFDLPFATLSAALSNANLKANDTIVVEEGHAETVIAAAGLLASVADVDIVGLGAGVTQPTFTFSTATTASFRITGAGVTVSGLKFVNGVASLATIFDIQAKGVVIQNCVFQDNGTLTGLSFINTVLTSANVADGLKILNNYFYNPVSGNYNHAIGLNTVQDNVEISGNYIVGNFALSGIHNVTGQVATNVNIHDNYVKNLTAAKPALNFVSAVTGSAYRNTFVAGDNTVNAAKFNSGIDASGGNLENDGRLDAGASFWLIKKGVVSSTITTTGVALTVASIGGDISIDDVILKTDASTGLAGGTNFQITSNNSKGLLIFFSTAVSTLGAAATVNMSTAGVTANGRTVLEQGKIISLSCTSTNCTGPGTVDVYIKCTRLTAGADVSLA